MHWKRDIQCQRKSAKKESKPVREILSILKSEGVKISDKSIYNIIKEKEQNKVKNHSFVSIEVDEEGSFNESFGEEECKTNENILPTLTREEDKNNNIILQDKEALSLISIINQGVKQGTEQFIFQVK